MPLKIIRDRFYEIVGRGPVLLSVPPIPEQSIELYMGQVAEEVALLSKAHAIIAKEPKRNLDPSETAKALSEFDNDSLQFLQDLGVKCVLTISGKTDPGFELQTLQGGPKTDEILLMVKARFGNDFDLKATPGQKDPSTATSNEVQTIGIGIGPEAIGFRNDAVISRLADLVSLIEGLLGGSEGNERTGDVLD